MVSEGGMPELKSEKKKEYKTSGSIKTLFTAHAIRPLNKQIMGRVAMVVNKMLQIIQLFW